MSRLRAVGAGLLLLLACSDAPPGQTPGGSAGAASLQAITLEGVRFPDAGLPDPCDILRAAGVETLLVRPLEPEPLRFEHLCMFEVDRGRRPEPQVSAALELAARERPGPRRLEDYIAEYGEAPVLAGATRDDLEVMPGLGEFAVWFPHADGSLTLSAFWGPYFLSVEVHGVDQQVAFGWSKALAARVIERLPTDPR